ncbi:MAG: endonuclease III domain-containing protein [Thermodesulfobacteriota bacterium]
MYIAAVSKTGERLEKIYGAMFSHFGGQNWWPAETAFECVAGAILTQNTAWTNVEKAIKNLKNSAKLTVRGIDDMPLSRLARLIKPSGYFNQKSKRLKIFARFVTQNYGGEIDALLAEETGKLRETLLSLEGIGPETADSITLYAAGKPSFVVDAYTKRITSRHGLSDEKAAYGDVQKLFEKNLPRDVEMWGEYHALIVRTAKLFCHKRKPDCENCPLRADLPPGGAKTVG